MVTSIYAILLLVILTLLAARVGVLRKRFNVSLGDGGHEELVVAIRQHGNFVEQVPYALIFLALAEYNGVWNWVLHGVGVTFVIARILHPFGLKINQTRTVLRATANNLMALATFTLVGCLVWKIATGFLIE